MVSSMYTYRIFEVGPNMATCKRRLSCPQTVQHLWDAVDNVRQQKQIANLDRIANYMRRKHGLSAGDTERQLGHGVRDGLLVARRRVGFKGSKVGVEQEAYMLPEGALERDGHDWYCFECHRGGDVLLCTSCHRVYHVVCVKEDLSNEDKFVCSMCQLIKSKSQFKMKAEDLNLLLGYTCMRLKNKVCSTRDLSRLAHVEGDGWKQNQLIYEKMDLTAIEEKTKNNAYTCLEEFQVDAQTIVHNVVIYYGIHSSMADMARQMLRDCCYDLGEIRQCHECYRMSNEKQDKFWFCQPCSRPHDLVFAKQKGFPYWPAKVIRVDDDCYDVRFFGGHHQRAFVDKSNIKPITTSLKAVAAKRTTALNKALDELRRHQQLLEQLHSRRRKSRSLSPQSRTCSSGEESESESREHEEDDVDEEQNDSECEEAPSSSHPAKIARLVEEAPSEDHNVVSSSSQESPTSRVSTATQTHKKLLAGLIKSCTEDAEGKCRQVCAELRKKLEEEKESFAKEIREELRKQFEAEKLKEVSSVLDRMREELEQHQNKDREAHEQELNKLREQHRQEISETKKKQWCYNCEAEAIYHCCWNTLYCSVECQQVHWHKEHKRSCRRKQ
ncbi:zinc finger MYND domain-containing protein 11-like isoform X2 [Ornithodoros turicata]|uniref:zinc finger MYND domain-containing protein 11-like isoform X2 n=1 Tax=Ornithodoros turicata TaxID=34597 RepID=UPI0031386CAA